MEKTLLFKIAARGGKAVAADLAALAGEVEGLERRLAASRQGSLAAVASTQAATGAYKAQATQARATGAALRGAGGELRQVTNQQKRLAAQTQRTNAVLAAQKKAAEGRRMRKEAVNELPGAAAPLLALGAPIKRAMDFESGLADVRKVVNFESPDGLQKLGGQMQTLAATRIPIRSTGLLEIAAAGGQLGIAEKNLGRFVTTTSKMAVAWDMAAGEAGEASAKLSNVYGIPVEQVERLGDAINHLSDNSPAKAAEIVRSLTRVGGVAKIFKLSATQTAALASSFVALGRPPEVAATAINGMLTKLVAADKQSDRFQAALADLGTDAMSLKEAIADDAQGALLQFLEAVAGADDSARMGILTDLFGLEYADDVAVLVGSLDEYKRALGLVGKESNYAGSMTREFENRSRTSANQLTLLINKVDRLAVNFGTVLLPALNSTMTVLGGVFDRLAALHETMPAVTGTLAKLTAGVLAAVAAFKLGKFAAKFFGGGLKEMWHGGRALGRRLGLGGKGKGGKAGALGQVADTLLGGGATPVFVTNWPGGGLGGMDLGGLGGRRRGGRQAAGRSARPTPASARTAARGGGKGLAGLAGRGMAWAREMGGRGLGWVGGMGGKLAGMTGLGWLGKAGGKLAGKLGLEGLGKTALKKVPGIGLLVGGGLALDRALSGDLAGAGLEAVSGLASLIPGVGTLASLAIDGAIMARDMTGEDEPSPEAASQATVSAEPDLAQLTRELGGLAPAPLGPINITVNQTNNVPGADAKSLTAALATGRQELKRLIEETVTELFARQQRMGLGGVGG